MYTIGLKITKDYESIVKQNIDKYTQSYLDFMKEFGPGSVNYYLNILDPENVQEQTNALQDFIYDDFWDNSDLLDKKDRKNCDVTAMTIDGDLLMYNKTDGCFYILPRQHDEIIKLGEDFSEVIKWLFSSNVIVQPASELYYRYKNKINMKRFVNQNPPEMDIFIKNIEDVINIDHKIFSTGFVDLFIKEFGAQINYSKDYDQLIIEYEKSEGFINKVEEQLLKMGFRLSEQRLI